MRHAIRFTAEKIALYLSLIEPLEYRRSAPIPPFRYATLPGPDAEPPIGPDVDTRDWEIIEPHTYWGAWLTDFALRTEFRVPEGWDQSLPTALFLPLGEAGDFSHPETLAYIDSVPWAACDRHHREILLPDRWKNGESHLLALHGWTGLGGELTFPTERTKLFMRPCAVVQIDQPTRDFIAAARVSLDAVRNLDENNPVHHNLLNALDDAFRLLDLREPFGEGFYTSFPPALETLRAGIGTAGEPLGAAIAATGHSHIDVAWLWTLGQTRRKAGRTFHTVLRLMEQFPDYHFTQSQPQLYDYVLRDYPELFEAIRERVREGRWEVIGGMWVEADCNLSGPESLARQFLLGRSFFRKQFGAETESPVLWLPDVFGYAWSLPQLIKEAGMEYFFTIKISWNQYNRLPYDTFLWQGIDGSRVLTHFSTSPELGDPSLAGAATYNSKATPQCFMGTWKNFQQKELGREVLVAYGYGDGGGGPTREMLENIRESNKFPGMPRVEQKSVGDFFRKLEADCGENLPVWNGELYLELHRGTYTTQSRNKRANRTSEFLLHDAEFLATLASVIVPGFRYPKDELHHAWELVCLNQFHDIIPGSSIGDVYRESLEQYGEVRRSVETVRDNALSVIADRMDADICIVNPTSFALCDLAFYSGDIPEGMELQRDDKMPVYQQRVEGGSLIYAGELEPYSITPLYPGETPPELIFPLISGTHFLESAELRVELNDRGDIIRIFDKIEEREMLPDGAIAGQFQAFMDRPVQWDAWDISPYYDDKMWLSEPASSIRVVETGPLRVTIEVKRRILSSEYTQRISIERAKFRVDFDTTIDWRERHVLLKAAFPVNILSPTATYEIQWGQVQRPTHHNTSWDWARFETCAQKWVDLSEGDYGVSLLNDCKYGHDIHDNVMRISLLRSPANPDPEADLGVHRFSYRLLMHNGGPGEKTICEAYALNDPLITVHRGKTVTDNRFSGSFIRTEPSNVVIETVKAAEDGRGIIVRMYESLRRRGTVSVIAGFHIAEAWRTNLLEENQFALDVSEKRITYSIRPFEIVTMRIVPAV